MPAIKSPKRLWWRIKKTLTAKSAELSNRQKSMEFGTCWKNIMRAMSKYTSRKKPRKLKKQHKRQSNLTGKTRKRQ